MPEALSSPEAYQTFVYTLTEDFPSIHRSTLVYIPTGALFGRVEGVLVFDRDLVLCVQEYLNFELGVIEGYGYKASRPHISALSPDFPAASEYCPARYPHKDKLYWYDSFPHPNDPALAATDPHHKHVHPDPATDSAPSIKQHRIPALDLSFTRPNQPFLIGEIERLLAE